MEVTILEAIFGCMMVKKIGKGAIQLNIPAGTQHGDTIYNTNLKSNAKSFKVNLVIPSKLS